MTLMSVHSAHLSVLDSPIVERVAVHRDLGSAEHGRLVHVVPGEQVLGGALVALERELLGPVGAGLENKE